jgi:hypothetical protein
MPGAEVLPFLSLGFRAVKLSCEIYTLMNIIEDHEGLECVQKSAAAAVDNVAEQLGDAVAEDTRGDIHGRPQEDHRAMGG